MDPTTTDSDGENSGEAAGVRRFAFVIHPLSLRFIHNHPGLHWTRWLPNRVVERLAAHLPPLFVSRVTGMRSKSTGRSVEGYLYALGMTPREMVAHEPGFTYRRLLQIAARAQRQGARIMGLGAYTSIVGDAGLTVARAADIAVTSGNSLTAAVTVETARGAVERMGLAPWAECKAMVVGATGSIGAACAHLMSETVRELVLVARNPQKLATLSSRIAAHRPRARIGVGTDVAVELVECDVVITATAAVGQRVVDIGRCKPGTVICDVAQPPDVSREEAVLRPDVLVISSGEVRPPGTLHLGYDIGLPAGTVYACFAETALLAMEGLFVDYSIGRELEPAKVREVFRLFEKHGFQIAAPRSFGRVLTDADFAETQALARRQR